MNQDQFSVYLITLKTLDNQALIDDILSKYYEQIEIRTRNLINYFAQISLLGPISFINPQLSQQNKQYHDRLVHIRQDYEMLIGTYEQKFRDNLNYAKEYIQNFVNHFKISVNDDNYLTYINDQINQEYTMNLTQEAWINQMSQIIDVQTIQEINQTQILYVSDSDKKITFNYDGDEEKTPIQSEQEYQEKQNNKVQIVIFSMSKKIKTKMRIIQVRRMDMMLVTQIIQRINPKQLEHLEFRGRRIRIRMQNLTQTGREAIKNHDYISIIFSYIMANKTQNKELAPQNDSQNKVKFNPDKYVHGNMTREEVIDLKRAFDIFDADGSGTIEPSELKEAFEQIGFKSNPRMIYQVLGEMDRENIGGFTFDDFFRFAIRGNAKETRAEIKKQFNLFDGNREGRITWDELKRVALDLGEDVTDDDMKKLFAKADLDEDGFVTFEDFYNIMTGLVYFD